MAETATPDLERAFAALRDKQPAYNTYWNYYDGNHPLVYSASRLREIFKGIDADFSENWAAVVVNAVRDRLQLMSFTVANDQTSTAKLNALWSSLELPLDADDAHLGALVCGESFVIAWPDADGSPKAYYNDPRTCHVFYDEENPRTLLFAAKWWIDGRRRHRIVLYYPDRLEYYATEPRSKNAAAPTEANAFAPLVEDRAAGEGPVADNAYGMVPVFHLRPERRAVVSVLDNVIPLQAATNKLSSDMMISAEFGAFRQRYVISHGQIGRLKNAPNEVWNLPAGDGVGQQTAVGEFAETNLKNFADAIASKVSAISAITQTPAHYFFHDGNAPSGEALIAMEAPLNKRVQRYIGRFSITWQDVGAFLLRLSGTVVDEAAITVTFDAPETVQPVMRSTIRQQGVAAGIALVTMLRREGWTEAQLDEMRRDRVQEGADAQQSLARALIEQQRQFDQNTTGDPDSGR